MEQQLYPEMVSKYADTVYRIAAAALLVLLCAAAGTGIYAAMKHWDLAITPKEPENTWFYQVHTLTVS